MPRHETPPFKLPPLWHRPWLRAALHASVVVLTGQFVARGLLALLDGADSRAWAYVAFWSVGVVVSARSTYRALRAVRHPGAEEARLRARYAAMTSHARSSGLGLAGVLLVGMVLFAGGLLLVTSGAIPEPVGWALATAGLTTTVIASHRLRRPAPTADRAERQQEEERGS